MSADRKVRYIEAMGWDETDTPVEPIHALRLPGPTQGRSVCGRREVAASCFSGGFRTFRGLLNDCRSCSRAIANERTKA